MPFLFYVRPLVLLTLLLGSFSVDAAQDKMVVEVMTPQLSVDSQTLVFSGTFTAQKHSMLSPRVDGLVSEVTVDAGSQVIKNALLLKQDSVLIQKQLNAHMANVKKAQVELDEAERLVKEAQRLVQKKHIPENELAIRMANLELSKASLLAMKASQKTLEETMKRHELIAPFSGVIRNKMTEVGEWVSRGDPVLELVSLDDISLDINVPQEYFSMIDKDTSVTVSSDLYPDHIIDAHIQAVVPISDEGIRAFLVRITLDSKDLVLVPGTSALATLAVNNGDNMHLLLPRDALLSNPDGSHSVFIIEDNKAIRRKVELGRNSDNGITIVSGINKDDLVVIRGNEVVSNQQSVHVKKFGE